MRNYMDRRVTPPKRVNSPTWGPQPPCKQGRTAKSNLLNFYPYREILTTGAFIIELFIDDF